MKTISKLIIPLFLLCIIAMSCSKEKCNVAMLSFNNKLSSKITVRLFGVGKVDIPAGSAETFKVTPNRTYQYEVTDFVTRNILISSEESVESCVSKGINIK